MSWRIAAALAVGMAGAIVLARAVEDPDTGTATWDAARAAGFASYVLLWASVVSGIAVHMRFRPGGSPLAFVLEMHRVTSALALSVLAGHVAALLLDPVVRFVVVDAVIPFTSGYRPVQVGLGTVAEWLLVAVLGTTAVAARMPYGAWRRVHLLSFPCYCLALAHGVTSGTSTGSVAALVLYSTTAAAVAAITVVRVAGRGWVTAAETAEAGSL